MNPFDNMFNYSNIITYSSKIDSLDLIKILKVI